MILYGIQCIDNVSLAQIELIGMYWIIVSDHEISTLIESDPSG
jgi:hypothetical protein